MARSPLRLAVLVSLAGLAVAGTQSSAVAAGTTVTLPIAAFQQMLVDPASHHVFISAGPGAPSSAVVVLGADGNVEGTLAGETGAGGMVLDGSTLYVARCGQGAIDEIDTTTLDNVGSIAAPVGGTCKLGIAGGRLWFGTQTQWNTVESVQIASPNTVTSYPGLGQVYDPQFLSVPGNPNELYVADADISASTVLLLDVSQPTPTTLSSKFLSAADGIDDWVLSPDGSTMYVAAGYPYKLQAFNTSDYSVTASYTTGAYPAAVDLSPSGTKLVGGIDLETHNVQQFPLSAASPDLAVNTADAATQFTPSGGVRYSEDGSRIFSITTGTSTQHAVELHVTDARPASTLTISDGGATTARLGSTLRLTGALHLPDGASPSGETVTITATMPSGSTRAIGQATANGNGNWGITTPSLKPGGRWVFHAAYAGGAYSASSASVGLRIGNPEPSLTVSARASTVSYGGADVVTVHLAKWHSSRTVTLYRSMDGSAPVKVAGGAVSSGGTRSFTVHPSRRTVYTARWAGDDTYLPKVSAGKVVLVRARLSVTQSGFYRSSGAVRLYHYRSGCWTSNALCPHFTGHLLPQMDGRPVRFTLQKLVSGRWETALAGTATTGAGGLSGVIYRYTGTGLIGHVMRVHATWAGNSDYLAATSPWVELELTK